MTPTAVPLWIAVGGALGFVGGALSFVSGAHPQGAFAMILGVIIIGIAWRLRHASR